MELINGSFLPADAEELLEKLVAVKIDFHRKKISASSSEEEIKMREKRISTLQNELSRGIQYVREQKRPINLEANLNVHAHEPQAV